VVNMRGIRNRNTSREDKYGSNTLIILIKRTWHEPAQVHIGKKGITEELIAEIKRQLKKRRVIKVRILPSCIKVLNMDRREIAKRVAEKCNARLAGVRGYTFVIYKV